MRDAFLCESTKPCFARKKDEPHAGVCTILNNRPDDFEECHFCKPRREQTGGEVYLDGKGTREMPEGLPERKAAEWAEEWDEVTARLRAL
jgi:hypothetical protein